MTVEREATLFYEERESKLLKDGNRILQEIRICEGNEEIIKLMTDFANLKKSEWCNKQREICTNRAIITENSAGENIIDKELILNAPEPE